MVKVLIALLAVLASVAGLPALAQIAAPPGAEAYFIEPADGATVKSPFTVKFGLKGFGIAPALVDWPDTGHFHLLIDREAIPPGSLIPNEPTAIDYAGGQTEAQVTLPPGTHTLILQIGDHQHIPHLPAIVSKKITITVSP
ncbi:MAG: DUF4399 domain-containing protein [Alphaproteobacteria bacterium]|nr:DUF4399 domain-containing protein [Alphaproteobacteria bacterium]